MLLVSALASFAASRKPAAHAPVEYFGKLNAEMKPGPTGARSDLTPLPDSIKATLPVPLGKGDNAYIGKMDLGPTASAVEVVVVEPKAGHVYLYVDTNGDHKFTLNERHELSGFDDIVFTMPLKVGVLKEFPYRVIYRPTQDTGKQRANTGIVPALMLIPNVPGKGPAVKQDTERALFYSTEAVATGEVNIGGHETLVQYDYNVKTRSINPMHGFLGVDCNGDGKVNQDTVSPENTKTDGAPIVFRVGKDYVSTKSVDVKTGKIVMIGHPASDYTRIEMVPGTQLPDFHFVDINGKQHKLSDYAGKYVLMDFWGTWCGPCRALIPQVKELYTKYHARGFDVLGVDIENTRDHLTASDYETGLKSVKAYVTQNNVPWAQTEQSSIERLAMDRFRILAYPTTLLIGPDGKIVEVEPGVKQLDQFLNKTLPANAPGQGQ